MISCLEGFEKIEDLQKKFTKVGGGRVLYRTARGKRGEWLGEQRNGGWGGAGTGGICSGFGHKKL